MIIVFSCDIIKTMDSNSLIGKLGENISCEYLVEKGYRIISRNTRNKIGEIDIITFSPDKTLVFVEVKTITTTDYSGNMSPASYPQGNTNNLNLSGFKINEKFNELEGDGFNIKPEDQMTQSKVIKFRRVCQFYANSHPELISERGYRLDLLSLTLSNKDCLIKHYKNIC